MLDVIALAFDPEDPRFSNGLAHLNHPATFARNPAQARRADWVVYVELPFGGPAQVLVYLGHYTHRVAIANSRIVSSTIYTSCDVVQRRRRSTEVISGKDNYDAHAASIMALTRGHL